MTHEPGAGFAADAYSRINGIGLVCVTYCVGGLNVLNAIAGAYAEKSPVVIISGAPGRKDREKDPLLHHKVKTFETQRRVYDEVTVATTVLLDEQRAASEIVRCIEACLRYKRPVYIEVPHDVVDREIPTAVGTRTSSEESDPHTLAAALDETLSLIRAAKKPVILAGVELARCCVVADIGDAIFGAVGIRSARQAQFIAPAYYTSMGFAVPASIGVAMANPKLRPHVLVGDGAFQMTGVEISTAVRLGLNPIILVLNNDGYGTMRKIRDGGFNVITHWNYGKISELVGGGGSTKVSTKGELDAALHRARDSDTVQVIEIKIPRNDISPQLARISVEVAKMRGGKFSSKKRHQKTRSFSEKMRSRTASLFRD